MAKAKATAIKDNTETAVQVYKTAKTPTTSGKSTLTYNVGVDDSGTIWFRVLENDGGGFFSPDWIRFDYIQEAIAEWPEGQGITSMAFRHLCGKSSNNPGFLLAVLRAEGLLEPMGDKTRVHQACNPEAFLAHVAELQGGPSKKPRAKAKAAAKKKAAPKAKAKTPRKATAKTANTPGKSPANSRKGK